MISIQNAAACLIASLSVLMVNTIAGQTIEPRKLMATINEEGSWSPDGKKISFDHAAPGECDIFTIDAPQK